MGDGHIKNKSSLLWPFLRESKKMITSPWPHTYRDKIQLFSEKNPLNLSQSLGSLSMFKQNSASCLVTALILNLQVTNSFYLTPGHAFFLEYFPYPHFVDEWHGLESMEAVSGQ